MFEGLVTHCLSILRNTGPDLRNTGPDLRNTGPDLRNTGLDLRNTGPDLGARQGQKAMAGF